MNVFIEKGGEKTEADVEKSTERGRPRFWIKKRAPRQPKSPRGEPTSRPRK